MSAPIMTLELVRNGRPAGVSVEPRELLLDVLRDRLGLTGAKRSCDTEVCGACTVLVDGLAVSACTYLAVEAEAPYSRLTQLMDDLECHGAPRTIEETLADVEKRRAAQMSSSTLLDRFQLANVITAILVLVSGTSLLHNGLF